MYQERRFDILENGSRYKFFAPTWMEIKMIMLFSQYKLNSLRNDHRKNPTTLLSKCSKCSPFFFMNYVNINLMSIVISTSLVTNQNMLWHDFIACVCMCLGRSWNMCFIGEEWYTWRECVPSVANFVSFCIEWNVSLHRY